MIKWSEVKKSETGIVVPSDYIHLHYYEAINVLFRVENTLRVIVYLVLKSKMGSGWKNVSFKNEDGQETTIGSIAKKRIAQDEKYGYLGVKTYCPLMYLTSGELIRIITDLQWGEYKRYFKADQSVIKLKLEEISNIRNALSHFRLVTVEDVSVIKNNVSQIFELIDDKVKEIIGAFKSVAANDDSPYVKYTGTEDKVIVVSSSRNERTQAFRYHVNIKLPIKNLSWRGEGKTMGIIKLVNYSTVKLIKSTKLILNDVLFFREIDAKISFTENSISKESIVVTKAFSMTFNEESLKKNVGIQAELEAMVNELAVQMKIVMEKDNHVTSFCNEADVILKYTKYESDPNRGYWLLGRDSIMTKNEYSSDDYLSEYWDQINPYLGSFITNTSHYPWIPQAVCNDEPLF